MHDVQAMHAMHDMHAMHGMHAMHAMPCYAMHVTQCNHLRVVPRELFGELPARIILCGQFPGSCSGNCRFELVSAGSSQGAVRGTAGSKHYLRAVPRELFGELAARSIICGQFPGSCSGDCR